MSQHFHIPTQTEIPEDLPLVVAVPNDSVTVEEVSGRRAGIFPGSQFLRYLAVGVFNTAFGYSTFAAILFLLNHLVPQRLLYVTVLAASILSTPLNITVAYFGYKFLVFQTRGNYLREWLKCFGVYGIGMLPGLFALSAVTRLLQALFHAHAAALHSAVQSLATDAHSPVPGLAHRLSSGHAAAGYLAGALVQGFTTVFSFVGHKRVTFKTTS